MNTILTKYNNAINITKASPRQKKIFASAKTIIGCDTETTGLFFHTPSIYHSPEGDVEVSNPFPFGISLAFYYRKKVVMVWGRHGTPLYDECKKMLANNIAKTWHNARYDLRVCKENSIPVGGSQHCTLTMSRIYWDRRRSHALQALTEFLCPELSGWEVELKKVLKALKAQYTRDGYSNDYENTKEHYVNYSFIPEETIAPYAATDAFMALMIHEILSKEMERNFSLLYEREIKVMYAVIKIEERGMAWNIEKAKEKIAELTPLLDDAEMSLQRYSGPDSKVSYWKTVLDTLLRLGVKTKQLTVKGKITTEADTLRALLITTKSGRIKKYLEKLLIYRKYKKTLSTYLIPFTQRAERNHGIIYTDINPTDTVTGRPTSSNPNLLNISRPDDKKTLLHNPIRECFICREGYANYYFDVSQQEMAFFGLLAGDNKILETYANGGDIHQDMAEQIGWPDKRTLVKNMNFGVLYGLGIKSMALLYGMSLSEAKANMEIYYEKFPSVKEFQALCKYELYQQGYVEDFFGRRYHVPPNMAYVAVNALVQGGCAQAFKIGLLNVDKHLLVNHQHIILPVYDELQIETPVYSSKTEHKWCGNIIHAMVGVPQLLDRGLRLRVDVEKTVTNWADKKELKI